MVSGDEVQLPDLQVIQRYSLAVRGATAPTADVIAALQSDLAWLTGSGRRRTTEPASSAPAKSTPAKSAAAKSAPARSAAKKTPAKKAAKKSGARRA
jgi:DNA end-binding protein Ku